MDRISKPRVFLSHSKKDVEFIERLERELRKCQIEPWLDEVEIRHGKPWLDAIFEDGIPSCDAVLVYFTENSLASKVVKKELDAGVISQLEDNSVTLLPYVESTQLRGKLRSDIKALHVPEWNDENFDTVLARCVAEVWRSFHERRVSQAIAQEKVKRLEAEGALAKINKTTERTYCGLTFDEMSRCLELREMYDFFVEFGEKLSLESEEYLPLGEDASTNEKIVLGSKKLLVTMGLMELRRESWDGNDCRAFALTTDGHKYLNFVLWGDNDSGDA